LKIIAVTDRKLVRNSFCERLAAIAEVGPDMIILNEPDLSIPEMKYLAIECRPVCLENGIKFGIENHFSVAKETGADSLLLNYEEFLRGNVLYGGATMGVRVKSVTEAEHAQDLGADYLVVGRIFPSQTDPEAECLGTELLQDICESSKVDVYASGGVNPYNISRVGEAGAAGVCITHQFMTGDNLKVLVRELKTNFRRRIRTS
jgi:thiamine-phosphate diphosphorylase